MLHETEIEGLKIGLLDWSQNLDFVRVSCPQTKRPTYAILWWENDDTFETLLVGEPCIRAACKLWVKWTNGTRPS